MIDSSSTIQPHAKYTKRKEEKRMIVKIFEGEKLVV